MSAADVASACVSSAGAGTAAVTNQEIGWNPRDLVEAAWGILPMLVEGTGQEEPPEWREAAIPGGRLPRNSTSADAARPLAVHADFGHPPPSYCCPRPRPLARPAVADQKPAIPLPHPPGTHVTPTGSVASSRPSVARFQRRGLFGSSVAAGPGAHGRPAGQLACHIRAAHGCWCRRCRRGTRTLSRRVSE